ETRIHRQRPGDLDHLLLGDGKVADERHRVEVEADARGDRARLRGHPPPVDEAVPARLAADEDVLGDGDVRGEGELLVDRDDAEALRRVRIGERHRLPVKDDLAPVRALRAGEDLEEGRLAGAVLAEERVYLPMADFQ